MPQPRTPSLSIVVVIFNMEREARRSLHSLSASYQHGVSEDDYEVIVVDNGSDRPFNGGSVAEFGRNFRYHYVEDARESKAKQSPARPMNIGVALARSDYLALMIDGARIVTPRLLHYGLQLPKMFARPCGLTLGWHIGPDLQSRSIQKGYNQAVEDALLERIAWPSAPYRLFEISTQHDPSDGWFRLVGESNFTFVERRVLEDIGGFDERFVESGGGLVNLDVQTLLYDREDLDLTMILGEGTFHQYHGGATSSTPWSEIPDVFRAFLEEYHRIRGRHFWCASDRRPHYVGHLPIEALHYLHQFVESAHPELLNLDMAYNYIRAQWEHTTEVLRHRDEGITWLRAEVAHRDATIATLRAALAREQALGPRGTSGATFTPTSWFSWVRTQAAAARRRVAGAPGAPDVKDTPSPFDA
jgi:hypothetical protein